MQRLTGLAMAVVVSAAGLVLAGGVAARSPSPSAGPSLTPCTLMTGAQLPLAGEDAIRTVDFAFADPAFPNPDPSFAGRFHAGEDWIDPATPVHAPVLPIGPGRVLASGIIGAGDRGGIVVVEHTGAFLVPASAPGALYTYPAETVDTILSAYAGIDPAADVVPGTCVEAGSPIGVVTQQCAPGVALPCGDLPPGLHLELRLATTADPLLHSADWSVVGPAADSSGGTFFDPQVMIDDGLREPSAFIASLAATRCPDVASPAPAGSPAPCPPGSPAPSAVPSAPPTPEPTSGPTPKPIRDPMAALLAGIPASVRDTCTRRTASLVTGTIVAVDCRPAVKPIKLITYFLLRPADARFVFSSRMAQYDLSPGADCSAGIAGVESNKRALSVGCYVDADGRANLRLATSAGCPAVYEGVLGTGGDIAGLRAAWDRAVGGPWQAPGTALTACRDGVTGISAPPAPTAVRFEVHARRWTGTTVPNYRLEVTWDASVTADTTIEIYAVRTCPAKEIPTGQPCLTPSTPLPASILKLVASAPADARSASWTWPGWEILGGAVAWDGHRSYYGIVARAVNKGGASHFVIAKNGNGWACSDCTY